MTWVRIDDAAPDHPKLVGLDDEAFALWVRGLCYCARHATDGRIPLAAVPRLTAAKKWMIAARKLQDAGLWDPTAEGYMVHDFLDYNPSAEQTRAKREARATAGRAGGIRSGQSRSKSEANCEAIASGVASPMSNPVPSRPDPVPDPDPPQPPRGEQAQGFALTPGTAEPLRPRRARKDPAQPTGEERLREAYVGGIRDAAPGVDYSPPSGKLGGVLGPAMRAHAGGLEGDAAYAWLRRTVAEYRLATDGDGQFQSGWAPHAFVRWLNAGRPRTGNRANGAARSSTLQAGGAWRPKGAPP